VTEIDAVNIGLKPGSQDIESCGAHSPTQPSGANGRGANGRFLPGNTSALVVGNHGVRFWQAADAERQRLRAGVLADRGFTRDSDAPIALAALADGLAQALLVRDAAFARLVESQGPLTSSGRPRRAYAVWLTACEKAQRHASAIGLERVERRVDLARAIQESGR
jgi:hypothetical protein